MNLLLTVAGAALVLAGPVLAHNHAGEGSAAARKDHGATHHGQAHHGPAHHGATHHGQAHHGPAHHADAPASSMLTSSAPANGAVLHRSPPTLALAFAHPVVLQNVTLVNAAGKTTKLAVPAAHTPTDRYQLALPKLAKGAYTVNWNAGGQHLMSGRLAFQVR